METITPPDFLTGDALAEFQRLQEHAEALNLESMQRATMALYAQAAADLRGQAGELQGAPLLVTHGGRVYLHPRLNRLRELILDVILFAASLGISTAEPIPPGADA